MAVTAATAIIYINQSKNIFETPLLCEIQRSKSHRRHEGLVEWKAQFSSKKENCRKIKITKSEIPHCGSM